MKTTLALSALALAPLSANAALYSVSEELLVSNTNPDTSATAGPDAVGSFTGTYDTDTSVLTYTMMWSGLSSPITGSAGAHIHGSAPLGSNAGVLHGILSEGAESGSVTGSFDFTSNGSATEADFLDNLWYVNIHTTTNPSGELRAQLNPTLIPEPSTVLLGGLALLGLIRRRR
jgi:hypothetical protein